MACGGPWDFVTLLLPEFIALLMTEVTFRGPVGETISSVKSPVKSRYYFP